MIEFSEFLTADLIALIPATALIFALEHVICRSLAEHYGWARLSRPAAYTMGVGTLFVLFLVHAGINGHMAAWLAFALLTAIAGITVKTLWAVNPKERPHGIELTNSTYSREHVLALMENISAMVAEIQMNSEHSAEAADRMRAYFRVMRANPNIDPDLPVAVIRRELAHKTEH